MKTIYLTLLGMFFYEMPAYALIDKYPGDDGGGSFWGFIICLVFGTIAMISNSIHEKKIDKRMKEIDDSKSLAEAFPEIAKNWNKESNRPSTPDKVKPTSSMGYTWNCPYCGRTHYMSVREKVAFPECPWCHKK